MILGPRYGTPEWHDFRRGLVTASRFGDVLSEPRSKAAKEAGGLSASAMSYLYELVASKVSGKDKVGGKSAAMERGIDKEADAIDAYCRERFLFPGDWNEGRIVRLDDSIVAATPDAFIEEDPEGPGIVEVKCPDMHRHLETMRTGLVPEQYWEQVFGQLEVTGRQWCDFVSFDDRFPPCMRLKIIRVYPSPQFGAESMPKIHVFAEKVQDEIRYWEAFKMQHGAPVTDAVIEEIQGSTNLFDGL